ncbi:MAG: hypothetical protein OXG35_04565 [Acidobacteria bacterium]|nr:hypothetical protein [Acidobacteriota bacterium]
MTPVSSPAATATVGEALDAWLSGADADPAFADDLAAITVGEALDAWLSGADADPAFADDLATIGASDRPPDDPWRRSPPPRRGAALRTPDRID